MTLRSFKSKTASYQKLELARGVPLIMLLASVLFPTLSVVRRVDRAGFDSVFIPLSSVSYGIIAAPMFYILGTWARSIFVDCRETVPDVASCCCMGKPLALLSQEIGALAAARRYCSDGRPSSASVLGI